MVIAAMRQNTLQQQEASMFFFLYIKLHSKQTPCMRKQNKGTACVAGKVVLGLKIKAVKFALRRMSATPHEDVTS